MTNETITEFAGMQGVTFPWWLVLLQGIIALILGICLLYEPIFAMATIIIFLGAYWFVSGIFTLFGAFGEPGDRGWKIGLGILGIILGLLFIAYPLYSTVISMFVFAVMVGVIAMIHGFLALNGAFRGKGWGVGILGILSILFGLLILANPWASTLAVPFVFGILGVVFGFAAIIGSFTVRSSQKAT
jgi:uncharacterized membrane protein HdeD (DUF308 family)